MAKNEERAPTLLGLESDGRDLFGLAAHKLNTPLACIRGLVLTLVQRGEQIDAETRQQFLQLVLEQGEKLETLVRDFLALARVQGGLDVLARPTRPRDLLADLIDGFGSQGARVQPVGDLDAEIMVDADLLRLALRPLVENGLAYGPRLGQVTVAVHVREEGTRWEVLNGGARISQDELDELFRPFTRADRPIERRGSGGGLGLTLARAYAEALGGRVHARVEETGTRVWLDVPPQG